MTYDELRSRTLAGMPTGDGRLGRPVETGGWHVPDTIRLEDGRLLWLAGPATKVWAGPTMFDDFLGLREASDTTIFGYAKAWGLLHFSSGWRNVNCEDHVSDWRLLSAHFQAVLNVAADLHNGKPPDSAKWEALEEVGFITATVAGGKVLYEIEDFASGEAPPGLPEALPHGLSLKYDRTGRAPTTCSWGPNAAAAPERALADVLSEWLVRAPMRLAVTWDESPHIELVPEALTSALVHQLVLAVTRSRGLASCSECGLAYIPKRRPQQNRNRYCPTCGTKAAWRNAKQKERRKG